VKGGKEKGDATIIRRHLARCNPLQNQALGFLNLHHRFPLVYNRKGVAFQSRGEEYISLPIATLPPLEHGATGVVAVVVAAGIT